MAEFAVGQTLFYVPPDRRGRPCTITIRKAGRKWLWFDQLYHLQADKATLRCTEGEFSAGRCYLSEEAYLAETRRERTFGAIRTAIRDHWGDPPENLTTEAMEEAARLLGIDVSANPPRLASFAKETK